MRVRRPSAHPHPGAVFNVRADDKPSDAGRALGPRPPVALSVAGFDPSSGAGITADLKTFAAHGVYGVACISALTVQSTSEVRTVKPMPALLVRQTLECLGRDLAFSGIKIGMLGSAAVARETARFVTSAAARERIVLDPVLRSSSGKALINREGVRILRTELLAAAGWITPNLDELAVLCQVSRVRRHEAEAAAAKLKRMAAALGNPSLHVVVTGGDLARPDDFLLTGGGEGIWVEGERVRTRATHGTGCAFSSSLLCRLIAGDSAERAVVNAKSFVTAALRAALPVGRGRGPMHHLFVLSGNAHKNRLAKPGGK
jgi:hydroxymethylpyrimidine/phosphomethylpyrimidine kinase